ncbi:EpsG family protein [uncultured Limosilactobacillus sp.]|uniref:EpsG family protein n=1 Tax=uncultured Limosilactobacillus sp. TaxID=2837629 RepID=UPI00258DD824|nr:EpsG family protein [uncultured Limosilactobacillus sp.]
MIYVILCLLIILGIVFPKSKYVLIFDVLVISLIIGLRPFTATDYTNYWVEYNTAPLIQASRADFPGYNILMRFCQYLGLSFNQFIFVIAFLSVILMVTGMLRFSRYVPFALSVFLIYPFAHEAAQMRTFLADSIVWCALPMLLIDHQNKIKNIQSKSIFFILTYIATTIHTLCWFYFIVAILYLLFRNSKKYLIVIFIIAGLMFILVHTSLLNVALTSVSSSDKLDHWTEGSTGLGMIIYAVISLLIFIMIRYSTNSVMTLEGKITEQLNQNIQKFSASILLVIPFLTLDITFNRLWRVFLGILYLVSAEYIYRNDKISAKKILYIIVLTIIIITMFLLENENSILRTIMV